LDSQSVLHFPINVPLKVVLQQYVQKFFSHNEILFSAVANCFLHQSLLSTFKLVVVQLNYLISGFWTSSFSTNTSFVIFGCNSGWFNVSVDFNFILFLIASLVGSSIWDLTYKLSNNTCALFVPKQNVPFLPKNSLDFKLIKIGIQLNPSDFKYKLRFISD